MTSTRDDIPHARLMTTAEDRAQLGIKPDVVEPWEDGRREATADGHTELWHFDASMADGTQTAVGFCLVGTGPSGDDSFSTVINVIVTLPDGRELVRTIPGSVSASAVGTDQCELRFGPHSAVGDFKTYSVTVEAVDGVGLELRYAALVDPYRPGGTAQIALHGGGDFHYAVHAVARCQVTGSITADGRTWEVAGAGCHDHQWSDIDHLHAWHHWLWGRFYSDNFTVLIYDLVASERFGFDRTTLFGVHDRSGAVIFDNRRAAEVEVETRLDPESGKEYPWRSTYVFRDGARVIELDFRWEDVLTNQNIYASSPDDVAEELGGGQRGQFDQLGIRPSYMRYLAVGTLTITDLAGTVSERGELIYEFNYIGRPDSRAPVG